MSETVEVQFVTIGNKQVLTAMQVAESPWLGDFIRRFSKCFACDYNLSVWTYYPEGDARDRTKPMKDGLWAEEVDEGVVRRVADIIGENSAEKRALEQLARRRNGRAGASLTPQERLQTALMSNQQNDI